MKYFITAFIAACGISACQSYTPPPDATVNSALTETQKQERMKARILGTYKGDFGGSPIYITINYCSNNKLAGYDTHKGLRRNLSGTITDKGLKYVIQLSEPGDHEFDGVFSLVRDVNINELKGVWKPVNSKSLTEKQLHLTELDFGERGAGFYNGDHSDFYLGGDGSCILNYYEKINDSTFSPQMITLRGTWEKRSTNELLVNWQPNPAYESRTTTFALEYVPAGGEREDSVIFALKGDIFSFDASEY
ncbi:hypothetical protein [Chitinophaga sp. S165]|uniref:hypothetical protein n=1 Tax=Chitinophaga sp. S165 TaxID=2135462 RepID=UPI000DA0B508|nr:hypothetical protein [Chitinophaga sp. S165]PWV53793.1 hypothetical protein C7475_102543 [Chitinophaga sp. S165]